MSLSFTDESLYVKGIGAAYLRDPASGNVVYYSNKFQTGQITPSADNGEIAAGLGNTLATMLPTNGRIAVSFTAADFDLFVKSSSVGGTLEYGAPVPVCQTVTATGAELTIDVTDGAPVANIGMSEIICYVQEVGTASPIATGGVAYPIDATTGTVTGFTATSGNQYKVTYFVSRANARLATLDGDMNGSVLHFTAEFAVFANVNPSTLQGTRWGTLYAIIPSLKLTADGAALDGDQTSNTTTGIMGQALGYDSDVVTADCDTCGTPAAPLGYYLLVPCDRTSGIEGIVAQLGGVISVPVSSTYQVRPRVVVNGELGNANPTDFTYALSGAPNGTSVSASGLITSGTTAGDGELTVTAAVDGETYTDTVNLSVVSA